MSDLPLTPDELADLRVAYGSTNLDARDMMHSALSPLVPRLLATIDAYGCEIDQLTALRADDHEMAVELEDTIDQLQAQLDAVRAIAERHVYTVDTGRNAVDCGMNLVARRVLLAMNPDHVFPDPPEASDDQG